MWFGSQRRHTGGKTKKVGVAENHAGVRLEMILGEVCAWVSAEGRRGGCTYDRCAASILYMLVYQARAFIVDASIQQRYEFYREAFQPLEKFVRRR